MAKKSEINFKGVAINTMVIITTLFCGCSSNQKGSEKPKEQVDVVAPTTPAPHYEAPVYHTPVVSSQPTSTAAEEVNPSKEPSPVENKPATLEVKLSRYYEEGYEKGYDDGEDDAVMDNGWGGQFDDECRYKGKKRKEYQEGYEDGYEAGYYDNKESDE